MKVFKNKRYDKRIIFIIPSLSGGGAEKAAINLANAFDKANYKIELILIYKNANISPLINKNIIITELNCESIAKSILKIRKKLLNVSSSIIISFITANNIAIGISKLFLSKKHYYIFTQHEIPSLNPFFTKRRNFYVPLLMRIFYPFADKIVCVSKGLEEELKNIFKLKNKIISIPNCIEINYPTIKRIRGSEYIRLLSVGRLVNSKDYKSLIEAIKIIKNDLNVKLTIVGNGPQKFFLEELIKKYNLTKIITIKDFEIKIEHYYSNADIYISTSLYESFGNTIVEAMHFNLKIISTNCDYGPREILENGKWGSLIKLGSPESIVEAIKKIHMTKKENNYSKVVKKYSSESIIKKYEDLNF
tara:strand:+ start:2341 stop:3426 length:1086 start_codon:yes stop_codon:yes gene_type:complete